MLMTSSLHKPLFKTSRRDLLEAGVVALLCIVDAGIYSELTKSGIFDY